MWLRKMVRKKYKNIWLEEEIYNQLKTIANSYNTGVNVVLYSILTTEPLCRICGLPKSKHNNSFYKHKFL